MELSELTQGDLLGVLAVPDSEEQRVPGVVVLGGSSGGIPTQFAVALAERGFACLGLGYFGVTGLKPALVEIPVELVERAVDWLARNPRVSPGGVCLFGVSKGAELALLAASLLPDKVRAVVAIVPSSVAFAGVDFTGGDGMSRSSWTWRGQPIPFVPYDRFAAPEFTERGMRTRPIYDAALAQRSESDVASIAVEKITAPVLLLSGADDQMWPSAEMAEALCARAAERGVADRVRHVCYPGAGHLLLGLGGPPDDANSGRPSFDFGGTPEGEAAAAADAWPRITAFLHEARWQN